MTEPAAPAASPAASPTASANAPANASSNAVAAAAAVPGPVKPAPAPGAGRQRRRALWSVAAIVVLLGLAGLIFWALVLRGVESTDNAYVQAPLVQVTAQVDGTVLAVLADDTDRVRAGQPLLRLDARDAQLALKRAEAQLGQALRQARGLHAQEGALRAAVAQREADVTRAQADAQRAQADVARALAEHERVQTDVARTQADAARRAPLVASGAVAAEELAHAQGAQVQAQAALAAAAAAQAAAQAQQAAAQAGIAAAQAGVQAAREQAAAQSTLTEGLGIAQQPAVEQAAAALREAWLALHRTQVSAPANGQLARRVVQPGQRIARGMPLMAVVALDQAWVDANFKESQLRHMRIGQPVRLHSDLYGQQVEFAGRIAGLGAGTGAAFALLPAQNATGNWVKVVQRVPVRIALDAAALAQHPLRVGLSMEVSVDVSDPRGPVLAAAPAGTAPAAVADEASTQVLDSQAEQHVQAVMARHGVGAAAAVRSKPASAPVAAQATAPAPPGAPSGKP